MTSLLGSLFKSEVFMEEVLDEINCLEKPTVVLDYMNQLVLYMNTNTSINWLERSAFYKMRLKYSVEKIEDDKIYFKQTLTYPDFNRIWQILVSKLPAKGYNVIKTERLEKYIEERNLYITSRRKLGIELKTDATFLDDKYLSFKQIVDSKLERRLRNQQMQDAFFMCAMKKSANFSVPGSGKTSSALAVYAYLKHMGIVDKIVMIGPKNAFGSWMDEFEACFGDNESLNSFNVHDVRYKNKEQKKHALKFETANCNLFLFNYEILGTYLEEISQLVADKTLLVFDEVHKVKCVRGVYAKNALEIAKKANHIIAMTGTPIPNSYIDLYNLLHILYNDEYKEAFNFSEDVLSSPSEEDVYAINESIQPFFCRTSKKALEVPAANEDSVYEVYADKYEQKLFDILKNRYRKNKLLLIIRILQMETNPALLKQAVDIKEFTKVLEIPDDLNEQGIDYFDMTSEDLECIDNILITSKKKQCLNLVEYLVNQNKTVIIWCIFRDSMQSLKKELSHKGITAKCIYGEVPLEERHIIMRDFKSGDFQVLITNPHTLAESVSLHTVCHDAIYYEYSYNLVHLLQSKDRIHRLGLPENQYTQYYYLMQWYMNRGVAYSLDGAIYERLQEKEQRMLDAIDNHKLEPVYTTEEDLESIFKSL